MKIIPVIDLMQGQVVHAKFGLRSQYQPIQSTLCNGSAPLIIVAAMLELYPFQTLYIADLDAILGVGHHTELIVQIAENFPQLTLWIDSGIRKVNARALHATNPQISNRIKPVVGSENIANVQDYRAISDACESQHILSLDYSATSAMGISALHSSARFWPDDTICMTLNAVGSTQGVDGERLDALIKLNQARKKPSRLYAAGGVRDIDDIQQLNKRGITGVLIATALHSGKLNQADLQLFDT